MTTPEGTPHNQDPERNPSHPAEPAAEQPPESIKEIGERLRAIVEGGDLQKANDVLAEMHPADRSEVLIDLPDEQQKAVLDSMPSESIARVMEELEPELAVSIAEKLEPEALPPALDEASPEVAADIIKRLSGDEAERALEAMAEAPEVIRLLEYADDTAGGQMTPDFPAVAADGSVATALDVLRLIEDTAHEFHSVFVVDSERKLVGKIGLRRLALARPNALVGELAEDALSVTVDTDQEECARIMRRYDLPELPVIDLGGRLVGAIRSSDLVGVMVEEDTEDMLRMAGAAGDRLAGTLRRSVRSRLPWLIVNLGTTFLAAAVIGLFESTVAKVVILAAFLPVVAGQGGIGGTQTMTLVVRAIALGEISSRRATRILTREVLLGLLHGAVLGLLVAGVATLWEQNPWLGLVLGVAMLGNMVIAGFVGAGVPLLLRRFGLDPAVSSAVVVTTATDVFGFAMFLGLASLLVARLV